ncbi:hypothetical protein FW774_18020 [Pedobacter sp. BS3]|uniref:hypothetical protein n=1 Tax=Pedobacter sp. BS3 TaxID=2567937 RepID=UPI0011EE9A94|nr:hypothetical protein [Pedobacter sp. BS3]TZF81459.1 hypothetical protein FW774_18020 [Pedobacter sp. BS3]
MKHLTKTLVATAILLFAITYSSNAQLAPLNMPQSDTSWSAPQTMVLKSHWGGTQEVEITCKLIKHYGTTGKFEVQITNKGPKKLTGYVGLVMGGGWKDLNYNNLAHFNRLGANYWIRFNLELRGCLPKGRSKMTDLEKCKACMPHIGFAEVNFD